MFKRFISVFIVVALIASLAACGSPQPAATTAAPAATTTAAPAATTAAATEAAATTAAATTAATTLAAVTTAATALAVAQTEAVAEGEALPTWLTQEKQTLTYLTHSGWSSNAPPPSNNLPKYIELERLTNVHVEYEVILQSEYNQIVNVRLAAGGELPDIICYTADIGRLPEYVADGLIISQDQLYQDRYPYTKALINGTHPYSDPMYETIFDAIMSINGVFYGPTQIVPVKTAQPGIMVNKFWLENLNLEMPETVDEFYEMLVAFRDMDANDNGDPNDEIPLVTEAYNLSLFANYFGLEFGGCANGYGLRAVDGTLEYQRTHENYREYMRFMNRLFRENLLDADYMSTDLDALYEYSANNKCGVINWWVQTMPAFSAHSPYSGPEYNPEMEVFTPIKPLKSDFGGGNMFNRRGDMGSIMTITASNKKPELSADWIDFLFASPESMDIVAFGVLGESYNIEPSGEIVRIFDDNGDWKRTQVGGGQQPHAYLEANTRFFEAFQPKWRTERMNELLPYYVEGSVYLLALTPDEAEIMSESTADMRTYINESHTAFIIGTMDINSDAVWDEYVNTVYTLGLPIYLEQYQQAYDRKYK